MLIFCLNLKVNGVIPQDLITVRFVSKRNSKGVVSSTKPWYYFSALKGSQICLKVYTCVRVCVICVCVFNILVTLLMNKETYILCSLIKTFTLSMQKTCKLKQNLIHTKEKRSL